MRHPGPLTTWTFPLLCVSLLVACAGRDAPDGPMHQTPELVSVQTLQRWHEEKARGGPTFSGSPAWRAHAEFVERELRARGVADLVREPIRYRRWFTADDPAAQRWTLSIAGESVPVASYWAYSGSTGEQGVTGPLVHYDPQSPPASIEGRIVVFDIPTLPDPVPPMFAPAGHEFATADLEGIDRGLITDHWYQVNYATRFGGFGEILQKGKAAGGIVIFDMGQARARGIYTFPLLKVGELGVPALYLDRVAGKNVRAAAGNGQVATLRLLAEREDTETWFLTGILPGRNYGTPDDRLVLLVTHTDGPNLTQENGALGILALVDYFNRVPQAERQRSLLIVLDPQHYMPGRHLVNWYERHPDVTARIVGVVGVEQLGQREYAERGDAFVQTGRPEVSVFFTQADPVLISAAQAAISAERLSRTELRVPAHQGQGRWIGLADVAVERGWPAFALNTEMSAYWSTVPGIESFDARLCRQQLSVLVELTRTLMDAGGRRADTRP